MSDEIKITDAYHPLGSPKFIDITVTWHGQTYNGLLEMPDEKWNKIYDGKKQAFKATFVNNNKDNSVNTK